MRTLLLFLVLSFPFAVFCQNLTDTTSIRKSLELGNEYLNKGRNDLALDTYQKALEASLKMVGEKHPLTAQCYDLLGITFWNGGNTEFALSYQFKALQLRKELFGEDAEEVASSYNNLGLIYAANDPDKALDNYENALRGFEKKYGANHPKIANTYNNIALIYMQKKDFGMANEYFADVLRIRKEAFGEKHPNVAFVYQNFAQLFIEQNKLNEAHKYLNDALSIYQSNYGEKHPEIANTLNLIGTVFAKQKKYDDALNSFQKSLIANVQNFNSTSLQDNPKGDTYYNGQLLLVSLMLKAQSIESRYYNKNPLFKELKLALQTLENASTLADDLRQHLTSHQDKIALGNVTSEIYEDAVRISHAMSMVSLDKKYYQQKAFEFAEKSKAAVLLESIADANAKSFAGIPQELLEKEKTLDAEIAYLEQQLAEGIAAKEGALMEKLLTAKNQKQSFIKELEKQYPAYFNLKFNVKTTNVADIQSIIDEKTALVSYFVPEKDARVYVFVISKNKFQAHNLPQEENFSGLADGLRTAIRFQVQKPYSDFAYRLYKQLINKLIPKNIEKLIIIPDGKLGSVPFESFLTKKVSGEKIDYTQLPYLVKKYSVSYNFSSTLYYQNKTKARKETKQGIFLCAPIHFETENYHPMRSVLASLLATEHEVKEIEKIFATKNLPSHVLTKEEAQEKFIKSGKLKDFQYIHFATHGVVDAESPERSQVFLANDESKAEDGSLYTGEIYNLVLDADLVTLSACETGLGKVAKGEGVIGLSRALAYAGARNMIVSLWTVADQSTSELMIDFYQHLLNDGASNAYPKSLQSAKKQMIADKNFASPFFWSPFILIGE
ncbi:MAG: CHAT domain-containing protein [Flammeovirgaceae bacterium]